MRGEQVFGQALRLLAEHQIAAVRIVCLVILPRRLCRKEAEAADVVFREKVVEVFIDAHIDQIPVVQPRTLDRLVRNIKAERLDQMQDAAGGGAGAGDVARVGRDLRLVQYDMQHGISPRAAIFRPMTQTRAIL